MIYTYTYNGTTYRTEAQVRNAIWSAEHKAFGAVSGDAEEFWAALGVEYTAAETQELTLSQLKIQKLNALKNDFNEHITGSFTTTHGYEMQFSPDDSIKMEGAIRLMESTGAETGYITQANDETVYGITLDVMKEVELEMLTAYATCHAEKQVYRANIEAAESAEELNAISFDWSV